MRNTTLEFLPRSAYARRADARTRGRRFVLERLEPRRYLDGEGLFLGADLHLTLSFASDGADVGGQPNALAANFNALAPAAEWQAAILRAFQTWAIHTNADIGLRTDGGQDFGVMGANQRDERFGDIRIGAIAMSPEVGAVSVAVDNVVAGTWFADVVFNTAFDFQSVDDIFAVALHEAGNVFGLKDNNDPNSPLFPGPIPTATEPTAADVALLQALHGSRASDANEEDDDNNDAFGRATELELTTAGDDADGEVIGPSIVYGDVASNLDSDFFRFTTPSGYSGPLTFQVRTAGVSLLMPRVEIYDADQLIVAQQSSLEIGGDSLSLPLAGVGSQQTFYIKVSGAAPGAMGVGGYSVTAILDAINQVDQARIDLLAGGAFRFLEQDEFQRLFNPAAEGLFNDDLHANDNAASATGLITTPGFADARRYSEVASISGDGDLDFYKVKSPNGSPATPIMTVSVRSLDVGGLIPNVRVLDAGQQPLPTTILVNGGGEFVVQVVGVVADSDYFIEVGAYASTDLFDQGNYSLTASFADQPTTLQTLASGVVGNGVAQNIHTLYIARPQLFHLALSASSASTQTPTVLLATIKNQQGDVVFRVATRPGATRTGEAVLLAPGAYTVEIAPLTLDGALPAELTYALFGKAISDPFVGDPDDPTGNPFECTDPELEGFFCYPGEIISPDPFLWDDFVDSRPEPPPAISLSELVTLVFADWWTWVWNQTGANAPPFALPDIFRSAAGPNRSVLENDVDPDRDAMIALIQSQPTRGVLEFATDGTFRYTPEAGFVGIDQFTYRAFDFVHESQASTVSIVVGATGDFDASGSVSGGDFLAWQRGLGTASGANLDDGDGDGDGDVDVQDLAIWRNSFGMSSGGPAAASATILSGSVAAVSRSAASPASASPVIGLDALPPKVSRNVLHERLEAPPATVDGDYSTSLRRRADLAAAESCTSDDASMSGFFALRDRDRAFNELWSEDPFVFSMALASHAANSLLA